MALKTGCVSRAEREDSILAVLAAAKVWRPWRAISSFGTDGWMHTSDVILMARGNPKEVVLSLNEMLEAGRVERKGKASYRWRLAG